MQMPTVQEQHKKLARLAGKWKATEKMFPNAWDKEGGTATARVESRVDVDGFFVVTDYVQERGGQASYRGLVWGTEVLLNHETWNVAPAEDQPIFRPRDHSRAGCLRRLAVGLFAREHRYR